MHAPYSFDLICDRLCSEFHLDIESSLAADLELQIRYELAEFGFSPQRLVMEEVLIDRIHVGDYIGVVWLTANDARLIEDASILAIESAWIGDPDLVRYFMRLGGSDVDVDTVIAIAHSKGYRCVLEELRSFGIETGPDMVAA